ncbi:MAG TPA: PilX N-terminal domain-containing pilus assembly protein [Steroidobacteraceae bacterium]|nr:PilX N-terminal domain-containing pilus assembly protein [Steroidobacteraceae bacterium]
MNGSHPTSCRSPSTQRGMALISGLLILVVLTILAMSMFRGYGTQQKIAGNVREKNRAVSAAVAAQQFAEYWLGTYPAPPAGDCTGMKVNPVAQVCLNSPDFTSVPWMLGTDAVGVTFTNFNSGPTPPPIAIDHPKQGTYFSTPMFYITDLGQSAAGPGEVYQIDAAGWGGTPDTVAVVESTFLLAPSGRNYDK